MTKRSRRGSALVMVAGIVVGLVLGVLAGVVWHEPIRAAFAGDKAAPTMGGRKQLWTCGMHPQVIREEPGTCPICHMALEPVAMGHADTVAEQDPATEHRGHVSATVRIDPVIVQNMGVRTAKVTHGPLQREVRAVAMIAQPQSRLHDINLRVGGWIEKLYAHTEGMLIREGEPLFDLYSPDVLVAVEELISARRSGEHGGETARITYEAAVRKLQLWGIADTEVQKLAQLDEPPRTITFVSPVTAEVAERRVVAGAAVTAGERVLQLADRSVVWLDAQVFAQDLPFVAIDQAVTATVESLPGRQFPGTVVFIHPNVDAMTRTALVRIELDNPDLLLRPGMYATVRTAAPIDPHATLVPDEAVIDTGTRQVVFLALGEGKFEPRTVKVGLPNADGTVQVLDGLTAGDTVVTSGQFLLDSESRMREAIQKYLRQGGAAVPEPAHQH